jgi:putative oxidoreductase
LSFSTLAAADPVSGAVLLAITRSRRTQQNCAASQPSYLWRSRRDIGCAGIRPRGVAQEETMNIDRLQPYLLSLFRFVAGLILFHYGVAKLFKFPPIAIFEEVTPFSLWGVAGMIEFVLGGMLMLGLLTRLVAFILSGEMAFAYFIGHFPHSFYPVVNEGGLAIILCFGCLYLASAGGGPVSLDAMLGLRAPQPSLSRG